MQVAQAVAQSCNQTATATGGSVNQVCELRADEAERDASNVNRTQRLEDDEWEGAADLALPIRV